MRAFFSAFRWPLLFILVLLIVLAVYSAAYLKRVSAGYLYAYPLVLMEFSKEAMLADKSGKIRLNSFNHIQSFPDHHFRNVVRPNVDTLYSIAWLDLTTEPLVLSVPDTKGRYYVMPLMDAWTNVFAMVGKRTHGTKAGEYLIAGPDWQGEVPNDTELIQSPTNMVWMIGRIQTNGKEDIPAVSHLQEGFKLYPFKKWLKGDFGDHYFSVSASSSGKVDPSARLANMNGVEFFDVMASLMAEQYPPAVDAGMLASLESIGVAPGEPFDSSKVNFIQRCLLGLAIAMTQDKIAEQLAADRATENGWSVIRSDIGSYGVNYSIRAAVSMIGLGALPPEEASYPNAVADMSKQPLSGRSSYRIHFEPGQTPPVDAFWSLTLYDGQGFLVGNAIERYAIGDRDKLNFNADGSLDILIQKDAPSASDANWLPAPVGQFALTLRLYSPRAEFLSGSWQLPPVLLMPPSALLQ